MLKARRRPDLGEEPRGTDSGGRFVGQYFEGDLPTMFDVVGEVDGRHPTSAEHAPDPISAVEGGVKSGECISHRANGCRTVNRVRKSSSSQLDGHHSVNRFGAGVV